MKELLNKRNLKKMSIIIIGSLLLGLIITSGSACINYLKCGEVKGEQAVEDNYVFYGDSIVERDNKYCVSEEGGELIIEFPEETYINKLQYQYETPLSIDNKSEIRVYTKNVYGDESVESIQDSYFAYAPRSVVNIKSEVTKIAFQFPEMNSEINVFNFSIDNSFKWNPLLMIMVSAFSFVLLFLILFYKENAAYPGVATAICIFVFSSCLLFMQPPFCSGWDEQIHFYTSYDMAMTSDSNLEAIYYLAESAPWLNEHNEISIEERLDLIRILNSQGEMNREGDRGFSLQISSAGYIFQAIAITIGKILQLPFYIIWLLGKFTNILLYSVGMGIAISIVPIGKRLLAVMALVPTMIFTSTIYTYDTTVIVFIVLGTSILLKEIVNREQKFQYKWRWAYFGCIIMGCLPKAVYAPLLLCAFLLPDSKFYSKRDKYIFKGAVTLSFVGLMATFVLPTLINPPTVADTRGGDTSVSRQLGYIFGNPVAYTKVLLGNIKGTFVDYMSGSMINKMAYMGDGTLQVMYSILLMITAITDDYDEMKAKDVYAIKEKTVSLVAIFATISLIWTALYLSFTEVGRTVIAGVQGRYYLPFLFLFYLCFRSKKIENKFQVEKYQFALMLLAAIMLMNQIYTHFYVYSCI